MFEIYWKYTWINWTFEIFPFGEASFCDDVAGPDPV